MSQAVNEYEQQRLNNIARNNARLPKPRVISPAPPPVQPAKPRKQQITQSKALKLPSCAQTPTRVSTRVPKQKQIGGMKAFLTHAFKNKILPAALDLENLAKVLVASGTTLEEFREYKSDAEWNYVWSDLEREGLRLNTPLKVALRKAVHPPAGKSFVQIRFLQRRNLKLAELLCILLGSELFLLPCRSTTSTVCTQSASSHNSGAIASSKSDSCSAQCCRASC